MARTMGGNATFESDIKGERVKEKAELRARQGRMNGVCPFGWRREYERTATGRVIRSWEVIHEPEAAVVREITDRLLRGDSLVGITADLNRRGVPAPGAAFTFRKKDRAEYNADGALWNKTSVKKLALRASNAGLRAYKGELLPGEWPPLVNRKDWDSVKRLLDAPGRGHRKTDVRPGRREHLLTWGVGYCGVCGGLLRVGRKGSKKYERPEMYLCAEQNLLGRNRETGAPAPKCCVGRRKEWVDELVRKVVIARLSQPDALAALSPDAHELADACARRDAAQADLDAIAAMTGKRPVSFLLAMSEEPQARLEAAEDEIRRLQGAAGDEPILAELAGPQVAERWDAMPVAARRRVLEILGVRVLIGPNTKHGPGFDPESVRVEGL
jgi:site-specific DNA recombinase